jgi:hypothetical protein
LQISEDKITNKKGKDDDQEQNLEEYKHLRGREKVQASEGKLSEFLEDGMRIGRVEKG